jgi:hypothetical protein
MQDTMSLASLTINSIGACPSQVKRAKIEVSPTFMDDVIDITDTILLGLDSIDADLKGPDEVTNPFNFDK